MQAGRDVLEVNFASSFEDPEGQPLTYSATSSNQAVITVSMNGSRLTITAIAEGDATATVEAKDPGGNTARITLAVKVDPAPYVHPRDDQKYPLWPELSVTASTVQWFDDSPGECVVVDPAAVYGHGLDPNRGHYIVTGSRWQVQDDFYASGWRTVQGTERTDNTLCVYKSTEAGRYRLVVEFTNEPLSGDAVTDVRASSNTISF